MRTDGRVRITERHCPALVGCRGSAQEGLLVPASGPSAGGRRPCPVPPLSPILAPGRQPPVRRPQQGPPPGGTWRHHSRSACSVLVFAFVFKIIFSYVAYQRAPFPYHKSQREVFGGRREQSQQTAKTLAALARGHAGTPSKRCLSVDLPATSRLKVSVIPGKARVLCLLWRCVEAELITRATFSWGSSKYVSVYFAKQSQEEGVRFFSSMAAKKESILLSDGARGTVGAALHLLGAPLWWCLGCLPPLTPQSTEKTGGVWGEEEGLLVSTAS